MVCLGRWASFPALDPVDPDSRSCSRIAANTKDGTLLKDLKDGFVTNKHTRTGNMRHVAEIKVEMLPALKMELSK
jgi:hypothetical protein